MKKKLNAHTHKQIAQPGSKHRQTRTHTHVHLCKISRTHALVKRTKKEKLLNARRRLSLLQRWKSIAIMGDPTTKKHLVNCTITKAAPRQALFNTIAILIGKLLLLNVNGSSRRRKYFFVVQRLAINWHSAHHGHTYNGVVAINNKTRTPAISCSRQ